MRTSAIDIYSLLKGVSRSFYLTVRVLPQAVRPQIAVAYLLARATDTVADTDLISVNERLEALGQVRERVLDKTAASVNLRQFSETTQTKRVSDAERMLVGYVEELIACVRKFSEEDQGLIRNVLATIISGQELDLQRFGRADASHTAALPDEAALDDYIYRVAGCVGEFWSRLCRAHLFPKHPLDEAVFLQNGIRFGKGLQLVNVLRDVPADLRQGRCYLPQNRLSGLKIAPSDLLEPSNFGHVQSFYNELLSLAEGHLQAGWQYTNTLPRSCVRLRLGCAWPILIGLATIAKLRVANVLDADRRVKVSRAQVRRIMFGSLCGQIIPSLWRRLPTRAQVV